MGPISSSLSAVEYPGHPGYPWGSAQSEHRFDPGGPELPWARSHGACWSSMGEGLGEDSFIRGIPPRRASGPEDVASVVGSLVSEVTAYITGQTLFVDGGRSLL